MHKEIKNLLDCFYEIISGYRNQPRNWTQFITLISQDARFIIIRNSGNNLNIEYYTVDQYIDRLKIFLSKNDFYEYGECYKIEIYNNLASAFTRYKAKRNKNDSVLIKQGINLVHFINDGHRWFISSMQWEDRNI